MGEDNPQLSELRILGDLELIAGDGRRLRLPTGRARDALVALSVDCGRPVRFRELVRRVTRSPHDEATARRVADGWLDVLEAQVPGLLLERTSVDVTVQLRRSTVDALRFADAASGCTTSDHAVEAMACWRADPARTHARIDSRVWLPVYQARDKLLNTLSCWDDDDLAGLEGLFRFLAAAVGETDPLRRDIEHRLAEHRAAGGGGPVPSPFASPAGGHDVMAAVAPPSDLVAPGPVGDPVLRGLVSDPAPRGPGRGPAARGPRSAPAPRPAGGEAAGDGVRPPVLAPRSLDADLRARGEARLTYDEVVAGVADLIAAAREWKPDRIVGINRGGAIVGGMIAKALGLRYVAIVAMVSEGAGLRVVERPSPDEQVSRALLVDEANRTGRHALVAQHELASLYPAAEVRVAALVDVGFVTNDDESRTTDLVAYTTRIEVGFPWDPE